jgi:hypothetical protein
MAGVERELTGFAKTAIVCAGLLLFAVAWAWIDFHYVGGVWTIGPADFLIPLVVIIAVPLLVFSLLAMLGRRARGLPAWSREVPPQTDSPPKIEDTSDPAFQLWNPPEGAEVARHRDRRVVVLADGSVIGELLGGRARRFASLSEFRDFVGT